MIYLYTALHTFVSNRSLLIHYIRIRLFIEDVNKIYQKPLALLSSDLV